MRLEFFFRLFFKMILLLFIATIGSVNSYPHWHKDRSPFTNSIVPVHRSKNRRGMDVDLTIKNKKPALELEFIQELEKLLNDTKIGPLEEDPCANCDNILREKKKELLKRQEVLPAYHCDEWDPKTRTCWVNRNVGNTVTFVLTVPPMEKEKKLPKVEWKQVFQTLRPNHVKHINIDQANPPWNIVVGSGGYELRLSPITEVDVDYNFFMAVVRSEENSHKEVRFRIRVMPIDEGLVYPGASLLINMFTYVSLPEESITFRWSLEKEPDSTLPSNMRLSLSGAVLSVSELRKEQEGIVVCSVFTNLGVFATQKRFLIRGVDQNNNLLVFDATRPPYAKEVRRKREVESMDYSDDTSEENPSNKATGQQEETLETDAENTKEEIRNNPEIRPQDDDASLQGSQNSKDKSEQLIQNEKPLDQVDQIPDSKQNRLSPSAGETDFDALYRRSGPIQPNKDSNRSRVPGAMNRNAMVNQKAGPVGVNMENVRDVDDILAVEMKVPDPRAKARVSDDISKLLAKCRRSTQCSIYAECVRVDTENNGFCRCLPRFEGTGIFCWEVYKIRT